MKILIINNSLKFYGGVETCIFNTKDLLEKEGQKIIFFSMDRPGNISTYYRKYFLPYRSPFESLCLREKIKAILSQIYSFEAREKIRRLLVAEKPDIVHIHTIIHGINPSIIHEIKEFDIPIVMTLHAYPLNCLNGYLFINNNICTKCSNGRFYNGFIYKCYGDSHLRSFLPMLEYYLNICILKIYNMVDLFLSPSRFLITKTRDLGFKNKIEFFPNFISKFENLDVPEQKKEIIFFGKLFFHKGIMTLIEAVKDIDIKLKIIGEGPLRATILKYLQGHSINNVELFEELRGKALEKEILASLFTVLPSVWYENCPYAILESFALGKAVIGSRIGGIPELIKDNERGLLFEAGDFLDLKMKIQYLISNPQENKRMGDNAKEWVEINLSPELYYAKLMNLYEELIKEKVTRKK